MDTTQNAPKWTDMDARQFDTQAPAQPLSLFPAPDKYGTPDMFSTAEEESWTAP